METGRQELEMFRVKKVVESSQTRDRVLAGLYENSRGMVGA